MKNFLKMIRRLVRGKTPREVLVEQAVQAALDRALHASRREYHDAMEKMLMARMRRIDADLRTFEVSNEG